MDAPLISIVLPIYNIEDYLQKCMDSLLVQTYQNLEIIMVDDGATDNSGRICDEYLKKDARIKVFHKKNGGLSDARNYGIERAAGEYITCIDPDDYVDPDYIRYLYSLIEKYHTRMSVCQHRVVFDNGSVDEKGASGDEALSDKTCIERMLYHDVIDTSAWAKLYHRSLFEAVKYPYGKLFEDIATTYQLMLQCDKIAVGYESKYNYIVRSSSIVNCKFNARKLDLLEMTDRMGKDVVAAYPDLQAAVLRRRVYARFSTLNQMLDADGWDKERQEIIRFIKSNQNAVLSNPKTPKRDIAAIRLLSVGYPVYKQFWKLYSARKKAS